MKSYSSHRLLLMAVASLSVVSALPAGAQTIQEDIELYAADGQAFSLFGWCVDLDQGVLVSGAYFSDNENGDATGAAYVFDAAIGGQLVKLLASDGAVNDRFGISIGIDSGLVAVGASYDDDGGDESGSAYVFDASTGVELLKLLASDGSADDQFGHSIAIGSGVVVVGAFKDDDNGVDSGAAYVFDATTGVQLFKLLPNEGARANHFGNAVAIDNGIIVVGAYTDSSIAPSSGAAYLFDASTGTQLFRLQANDGAIDNRFGTSVAIDHGVVAIGAPGANTRGQESGAAYLFDASTGAQTAKLVATEVAAYDLFGSSVAIGNGILGVGSVADDDVEAGSGSAFFFDASTGTELAKFLASEGVEGDQLGASIAVSDGIAAVGAVLSLGLIPDSGSVYVLDLPSTCPVDLTGDGELDFFDVSAFLNAFALQDPIVDYTNDGLFDFFDVSAFLDAFGAGCP